MGINENEVAVNKSKWRILRWTLEVLILIAIILLFLTSSLFAEDSFKDWSSSAMDRWIEYGLIEDDLETTDRGASKEINRAQAVTILNKINNVNIVVKKNDTKYKDISANKWYYEEIEKAIATGLINGYANGEIKPDEVITRQAAMQMVANLFDVTYTGSDAYLYIPFSDKEEIDSWFYDAIAGLVELGYIEGYEDGTFRPKENITRGEFISLIDKIASVLIDEKGEYNLTKITTPIIVNAEGTTLHVNSDATVYLMCGSNGEAEIISDSKELEPLVIKTGAVLSNASYTRFSSRTLKKKNLNDYASLTSMPEVTAKMMTNAAGQTIIDPNSPSLQIEASTVSKNDLNRLAGTDRWNDIIYKVSKEEEIDPVFVKCIMAIESAGTPGLTSKMNKNGTYDYGLMQVNSSWSSSFDMQRILTDNEYAIRCGIKIIKRKIEAAERSGKDATVHEVAWRYNGYSSQGYKYAQRLSGMYEAISGMSRYTLVRTSYASEITNKADLNKE